MFEYRARLLKIIDGDTLRLECDVGFYVRAEIDVRLKDVWAPELSQSGGQETRTWVAEWLEANTQVKRWPIWVQTEINTLSEPTEVRSFVRYVGTVRAIDGPLTTLNDAVNSYLARHPEWTKGTV